MKLWQSGDSILSSLISLLLFEIAKNQIVYKITSINKFNPITEKMFFEKFTEDGADGGDEGDSYKLSKLWDRTICGSGISSSPCSFSLLYSVLIIYDSDIP